MPEEYIDLGEWVVVPTSGVVHGRGSGIEIEIRETYAVRLRGETIVRVEEYRTKKRRWRRSGQPGGRTRRTADASRRYQRVRLRRSSQA